MKVTEFTHRWVIDNVKYQAVDNLKSAIFSSPGADKSRFYLFLTDYRMVDVRLALLSSLEPDVQVKWKLEVLDKSGKPAISKCNHNSLELIDMQIFTLYFPFADSGNDRLKPVDKDRAYGTHSIIDLNITSDVFLNRNDIIRRDGSMILVATVCKKYRLIIFNFDPI